jgi:NADH-quinone oxidoreductase subunit C
VTTTDEQPLATVAEDPRRRSMLETLQTELGDAVVGFELTPDDLWVRVQPTAWRRTGEVCRNQLGMSYFCFLSGIDWAKNPDLLGEKAWEPEEEVAAPAASDEPAAAGELAASEEAAASDEPGPEAAGVVTGVAGGQSRFQLFARLYNVEEKLGITLKADLDTENPQADSWASLWRGADWHERECWEMFGFQFPGHPRLRHLYLPQEFEGHPLRKDFPLLARVVKPWPGLVDVEPMPGEPAAGEGEEGAEEG